MAIEITSRHMHVSPDIQEYVRQSIERLIEHFPRVEHVHVILDHEKHLSIAEVVVQAKNHIRVEAKKSSKNIRMSFDDAANKVEKQLRRLRDKAQSHKVRKNAEIKGKKGSSI